MQPTLPRGLMRRRWMALAVTALALATVTGVSLAATLSQSGAGAAVYFVSTANGDADIWAVVQGQSPARLTFNALGADDVDPAVSRDGRWLAFSSNRSGDFEIWVVDLRAGTAARPLRVTVDTAADTDPAWSPDGTQIVYVSNKFFVPELMIAPVGGCGRLSSTCPRRLTENKFPDLQPSWSPDGRTIAFASKRTGDDDVQVYAMAPTGAAAVRLTTGKWPASQPAWSPDGSQIAFISKQLVDKLPAVYAMRRDGSAQSRITAGTTDDSHPSWSPDGQTIAFASNVRLNVDVFTVSLVDRRTARVTTSASADRSPVWGAALFTATPTPTRPPLPTSTPQAPLPTSTPTPTATPVPPTATPTRTPTATPTQQSSGGLPQVNATPGPYDHLLPFLGAQLETADGEFLGDIRPADESFDSICNESGPHGSPFSNTSIRNPDGEFGSPFSDRSAFNPAASNPPVIVLDGQNVARLTTAPLFESSADPVELLALLGCSAGF